MEDKEKKKRLWVVIYSHKHGQNVSMVSCVETPDTSKLETLLELDKEREEFLDMFEVDTENVMDLDSDTEDGIENNDLFISVQPHNEEWKEWEKKQEPPESPDFLSKEESERVREIERIATKTWVSNPEEELTYMGMGEDTVLFAKTGGDKQAYYHIKREVLSMNISTGAMIEHLKEGLAESSIF